MTSISDLQVRLVDVSQWQDNAETSYKPNFERISAAGFMGVVVRVGYGLVEDRLFQNFWEGAKGKLTRGGYWYLDYYSHRGTGTTDTEWGVEQANVCYELLKSDFGELPLALDLEDSRYGGAVTPLNSASYNKVAMAFIAEWRALTKSDPVIYASPGFYWLLVNRIKEMESWLALYNRYLTVEEAVAYAHKKGWRGKIRMWQYSDDGDIDADGDADGIALGMETAKLDLNVFLGSVEEFSAWAGTTPPVVDPPSEDEEPGTPVDAQAGEMKVAAASGLNIRDVPIGQAGSQVIGWMPVGMVVTPLEIAQVGADVWARVEKWKWAAVKYNGVELMK